MIVKLLGLLDILIAVCFWLFGFFNILPGNFMMILAFILLAKGLFFLISMDIASMIDIAVSVLIFISLNFHLPKIVVALIVIYLLQKGIFSML